MTIKTKKKLITKRQTKINLDSAFVFKNLKVPMCCRKCSHFIALYNQVLNLTTVDCKKKIFFPTKQHVCERATY